MEGIVANSSVVPGHLLRLWDRIDMNRLHLEIIFPISQ